MRCKRCGRSDPDVSFRDRKRICLLCESPSDRKRKPQKARPRSAAKLSARDDNRHMAWIRHQPCLIGSRVCQGVHVHAHHVRRSSTSGTGLKPDACYCVPLCAVHHWEGHNKGWDTFERKYNVGLDAQAAGYARRSPHLRLDNPSSGIKPTLESLESHL